MAAETMVCVMGLGYIGLPTASLIATRGWAVTGVDIRPEIVDTINRGDVHIEEPELDTIVRAAVGSGRLRAAREPVEADIFLIAVPTPLTEAHAPDLSMVFDAADKIAPCLKPGALVILESTSPIGTTEAVAARLAAARPDLRIDGADAEGVAVAYCPERVLPGQIIRELVENDRVVGGVDPGSALRAAEFYRTFVSGEVFETTSRTAELVKLSENAYRDVNIAFANELSLICEQHGIDVWELIGLANRHPRVNILRPGPGVGGHCIAVDPWFIVHASPERAKLIRAAREVNDSKPGAVVETILRKVEEQGVSRIALLGLTYKPDVDDLRESPSIRIAAMLAARVDREILVADPYVAALPSALQDDPKIRLVSAEDALSSDALVVVLVPHRLFPWKRVAAHPNVLDVCGALRSV